MILSAFRFITAFIIAVGLIGCAVVPYEELKLDTTSNFRNPPPDKAGIYVYQWKTGVLGAAMDVNFEIKGQPKIALNTGEYGYLEVLPGKYEYKVEGLFNIFLPVKFESAKNYFFRATLVNFSDAAVLIRDQNEIDEAKQNIFSGRYEKNDVD
jgi:hypothetical protein